LRPRSPILYLRRRRRTTSRRPEGEWLDRCLYQKTREGYRRLTRGFDVAWEVKAPTRLEVTPLRSMAREVAASKARVERVEVCIFVWEHAEARK